MTSPTSDPKADLLIAILAMDSYNQGYDAGLKTNVTQIGSARLDTDSTIELGSTSTQELGFYAAAYTLDDGTTVISYRGTDNSVDYFKGWPIAAGGFGDSFQTKPTLDFYNAVTGKTYKDGAQNNVILTGHSLAGGLAGYVSALSGTKAVIFDHMPFGLAASLTYVYGYGDSAFNY